MESLAILGTITLVHIMGLVSPGPDFVMVIRNSLTYSRRTGIYTAIGIAVGVCVHLAYGIAGLAIIISKSILVFNAIKMLGAAYLIYIGIKSFRSKSSIVEVEGEKHKNDISRVKAFKIGFLTNVLNPKATIWFLSMFTLVISPDLSIPMLATACALMIGTTGIWFTLVSVFFTQKHVQKVFSRFQGAFNKGFGALLVALGLKVATSDH